MTLLQSKSNFLCTSAALQLVFWHPKIRVHDTSGSIGSAERRKEDGRLGQAGADSLLPATCPYLLFGASEDLAKSIGHVRVRTSHANLDKPKAAHTPAAQARRPSMQSFFTKSTFRCAAAMHKGVQPSFAPGAECPNHESLLKQSARLLRWACLSQPGVSCAHQSSWLLEAQQNVAMQERALRTLQKVEAAMHGSCSGH